MRTIPIIALDVDRESAALEFVDRLGDAATFYKVGNELFTSVGPSVVRALRARGRDVFLDLKLHDIPNTVRGAAHAAASLGARLLTVHAAGGRAMLDAGVEGAGSACGILAVTVLTSLDAGAVAQAWGREGSLQVGAEVLRLAAMADEAGAHGIVCGGTEAASVRAAHPRLSILVPGIRPAGNSPDDQARVVTPRAAMEAGARYVVLGRAVTAAADPVAALLAILSDLR